MASIFGSIQVSGDAATFPWVGSRVWVGAGLGLALREEWVGRVRVSSKGGVGG